MQQKHDHPMMWQEDARKAGGEKLVLVIAQMLESQRRTEDRLTELEAMLKDHVGEAFPGGDAEGHRRAHEAMIELTNEKRRLRAAIMEKTLSGLVWSLVIALGVAAWEYIKDQARR